MKYGGDVKSIKTDKNGGLSISSDIEGISTTVPVSYYGESLLNKNAGNCGLSCGKIILKK